MLLVGNVIYANEEYLIHYSSNGSKIRFILLSKYTESQREEMLVEEDEVRLNYLRSIKLQSADINKERIEKYKDYVISAFQSDKRGKVFHYIGDLRLLNNFVSLYEDTINNLYVDGKDGCTITDNFKYHHIKRVYENNDFVEFDRHIIDNHRINVKFYREGIYFETIYNKLGSVHVAPYKSWEWEQDISFSTVGLKRKVVSLSAKTLEQLRQEKDLSWYFNSDGTSKKDYKVLHTIEEVKAVVNEIEEYRLKGKNENGEKYEIQVSIDCETTGLLINSLPWKDVNGDKNSLKDEIGGMSLTWKHDQGVYIPFIHTKFQNVPRKECLELLHPYLEKWYLETHNGLFDGKVYLDNDIKLNIMDDSMIMLFNIDPNVSKGSKGLKESVYVRYGHEVLDHDDVFPSKESIESFYDLSEDIVKIYACADSDYTFKLCYDLRKEIPSQKAYRLDMNVLKYLIKVNYNGNRVDEVLLNQLAPSVDEDIATLEEAMFKFVGQAGMLTRATLILEESIKHGKITREEADNTISELKRSEEFKTARYEFAPSKSDALADVMYNRLNYPVVRVNKLSKKPSADKYALSDLKKVIIDETQEEIGTWMKEDIISSIIKYQTESTSEDRVLVSAEEFNKHKYPFVLLLSKWKELMKLKTTFFAWFLNGSCDNMYFSDFSMTNADTSRIIGRVQTLKGSMKKLVIPYSDEYYLMGVDFSQIEARLMAYLAGDWDLVERLCNPRADYHVESAAVLTGKESWQITKQERSDLKAVNFAVPYGMLEYSLAENLYGRPVTKEKINKAVVLLAQWSKSNWRIQALLDAYRKFAKEKHRCLLFNSDTRKVEYTEARYIMNKAGRRRYFNKGKYEGDNLSYKIIASIERMAGNYPIQAYAAEIFKKAFVNINRRLEKEGLADKVITTALVHDEFLFNVHRSVDKYKMYKILWEEMVQSIYLPYKDENGDWETNEDRSWKLDKSHLVKYFYAGISIGHEWHDIHSNDAHEAPTEYLEYVVNKIDNGEYKYKNYESGDVVEECFNEIMEFMRDLILKECYKIQPDINPDNIKFYKIVPAFYDYFLKNKLKIYQQKTHRVYDKNDVEDEIRARLETLMMDLWKVDTLRCFDTEYDEVRLVSLSDASFELDTDIDSSKEDDLVNMFDDLFDSDFDNFDDEEEEEDVSIPINIWNRRNNNEEDFKIIGKRNGPTDSTNAIELIDFGQKINTYKAEDTLKFVIRSDSMFIDLTGVDIGRVKELISYFGKNNVGQKKARYLVKFKLNGSIKDSGIGLNEYDRDKIFNILGWKFSDMLS